MDYLGQNLKIFKNRLYHRNQRKILKGGSFFCSNNMRFSSVIAFFYSSVFENQEP